jgi:hypothetical protein
MKTGAKASKQHIRRPGSRVLRQAKRWANFSLQPLALSLFFCLQPSAFPQASICAQVKIEILQELTLEREAFEARMTINNGVPGVALTDLGVDIWFKDKSNATVRATTDPNDLSAKFFWRHQTGSGIPVSIPGESSAKILWLIIPAPGAAGQNPQGELYFVGATLRYRAGGEDQEVEVSPDSIYVKPMPSLALDYFLPKEVYGDDPFTENVVEPVVPFSLGVRVKNAGYGTARNLKIESAQPRITDNKLGLLVDFSILGSEVNGRPATSSLLCDFGDIPANRSSVARWTMISTLSGRFVEFTANFTHADELGGQLTSLISNVTPHLLVRDVLVDLPGRDGVRDFLAKDNDVIRVYESENADTVVTDVSATSTITGSGDRFTVDPEPSSGFIFIQKPDPLAGTMRLKSATRADNKSLNLANTWLSQTWDRDARHWNYFVNIFDVNNTAGLPYSLVFEPTGPPTNRCPPAIDPIPDRTIYVGNYLSFPISAFDCDGDAYTCSLLSSPPGVTNATLRNCLLQWRPLRSQAPSTNVFWVRVTDHPDNGTPSKSSETNFTIIVLPVYGFQLTFGSTNIFAGESNTLPIVLKSELGLTNLALVLVGPAGGQLTNFDITALGPEVYTNSPPIVPLGSNRYWLTFDVDPARVESQTRTLGLLTFQSVPMEHSAIIPLPTTNLVATDAKGAAVSTGSTRDARVIVFALEPILVANPDKTVTLYGRTGASYAIEAKSNLLAATPWQDVLWLPLSDRSHTVPAGEVDPSAFFRAREFQAHPPVLQLEDAAGPVYSLLFYGRTNTVATLETAPGVGDGIAWQRLAEFSLESNSWVRCAVTNWGDPARVFRINAR